MKTWMVALLLAASLAGCVGGTDEAPEPTPTPEPTGMPEDPMPEGDGHDHGDVSQHKFLWNYEFTARDPILSNPANAAGLHALDIGGGYLFGATYGSHSAGVDGGMQIWDIREPNVPVHVGAFRLQGAVGGDRSLEVTDDGNFAVLATEPLTCFGQVSTNPADVYLIDTRDKTNPVVADVVSIVGGGLGAPGGVGSPALGVHSVVVHTFGEDDYAFLMGDIYRIERGGPTGATLVDTGSSINVGHDMYIRDTPWGTWALSANGGRNFQIYDVTDPVNPVEIAVWEGDGIRYLHTADMAIFDDGQALVALSSEDWEDHPSLVWIFDVTELQNHDLAGEPLVLEPKATWVNPGEHTAEGLSFSLHNPRWAEDGIFTISSYHGGLWQLDFRAEHQRFDPEEIAYAVYAEGTPPVVEDPVYDTVESSLCGLGIGIDAPTYMDVELGENGTLYAADVFMGLYTFKPAETHPVYG